VLQTPADKSVKIKIVLSDNSTTTSQLLVSTYRQSCELRIRGGSLTAIEHFNMVLSEVVGDYFVMLHDDDILAPGYFDVVLGIVRNMPDTLAIAVNGWAFNDDNLSLGQIAVRSPWLLNPTLSAKRYLSRAMNPFDIGIPPVSGLLMERRASEARYDTGKGGKHCDISFVGALTQLGRVVQSSQVLVYSRLHSSNDTKVESTHDRRSLLKYVQRELNVDRRHWLLIIYRYFFSSYVCRLGVASNRQRFHDLRDISKKAKLMAAFMSVPYLAVRVLSLVTKKVVLGREQARFRSWMAALKSEKISHVP